MSDDDDSSQDESFTKTHTRERILSKVSCPLNYKVETKIYKEQSKGLGGKNVTIKKPFIRLIKIPDNFNNPWKRSAEVQPDGRLKVKQGIEKLLLNKIKQKSFMETVRINAKLKVFR